MNESSNDLEKKAFRTYWNDGLIAFFTGAMAFGFIVYVLWNGQVLPRPAEWIAGFPLVLIGIPAVFFAIFTNCRRFALYALVLFLAGVEVILRGWDPHVGLIASGIVITSIGLVIFVRFLTRYPAQPAEIQ